MRNLNIFYICWLVILIIVIVFGLAKAEISIMNSFNSGEVTGQISGRADVKKYYSACRKLENMYVQPQGGAAKRPGTYWIAEAGNSESSTVLITFEKSIGDSIIMELSNEKIQFYK